MLGDTCHHEHAVAQHEVAFYTLAKASQKQRKAWSAVLSFFSLIRKYCPVQIKLLALQHPHYGRYCLPACRSFLFLSHLNLEGSCGLLVLKRHRLVLRYPREWFSAKNDLRFKHLEIGAATTET